MVRAGAVGVVGVVGAAAASALLHLVAGRTGAAWIAVLTPVWALAVLVAVRRDAQPSIGAIAAAAAAVRLPLVGCPPLLSDDVFRYLWEGRVLAAGGNPFLDAPLALPGLDDALRARVNHPELPSIYPPLALTWFRLLDLLGGSVVVAQLATAAVDVVVAILLAAVLRARGRPTSAALLYAVFPLSALESAVSAHVETPAIALLAAALLASDRDRPRLAGLLAGLGGGVKLLPAVFVPSFARKQPREVILGAAAAALVVALSAIPVLDADSALFTSLRVYAVAWSFNGFVFPWASLVLGSADRPVLVVIGMGIAAYAVVRQRDPAAVWLAIGGAFVLLTPTAHPWYAQWALFPALVLDRRGWIAACGFVPIGYAVLAAFDVTSGSWREPSWLWFATWVPVVLALAWDASDNARPATATNPPATSRMNGSDAM